jgi:hypothetical protein
MLLHSGSGQYIRFRETIHIWYIFTNIFIKQFLWYDLLDMLGGKIIGEGVDGCILSRPMWPCATNSLSHMQVNSMSEKYVSKVVSINDKETDNLKIAARILGPDLSSRYIAGLEGECSPADKIHKSSQKNYTSMKSVERNILSWPKKGQACQVLKEKLLKGKDISKNSKVMVISKYDFTVSKWVETIHKQYDLVLKEIEHAIPQFMIVLQKLYQGKEEQLIHIDTHTGNIFIRILQKGIEFGLADFGRCVFRRHGQDPSRTFYGEFLIDYVSRNEFYCGYSQVPFESRLMNFCFKKNLDNVSPSAFVRGWENDNTVKMDAAGSTDIITVNRSQMITYLLKRILFIAMIEKIQSICKKIRLHPNNYTDLYMSLSSTEKIVIEFILTRYSILSPLNTISEDIMNKYNEKLLDSRGKGTTNLIRFLMLAILAPYDQEGSSLDKALSSVEGSDMGILWADVVKSA